jgi:hypothetical protein
MGLDMVYNYNIINGSRSITRSPNLGYSVSSTYIQSYIASMSINGKHGSGRMVSYSSSGVLHQYGVCYSISDTLTCEK